MNGLLQRIVSQARGTTVEPGPRPLVDPRFSPPPVADDEMRAELELEASDGGGRTDGDRGLVPRDGRRRRQPEPQRVVGRRPENLAVMSDPAPRDGTSRVRPVAAVETPSSVGRPTAADVDGPAPRAAEQWRPGPTPTVDRSPDAELRPAPTFIVNAIAAPRAARHGSPSTPVEVDTRRTRREAEAPGPAQPVQVTIDHIEVRVAPPPRRTAAASGARSSGGLDLATYLSDRSRRSR
ncbi:MAG: hypothetical protein K0V04_07445 [Deltaproteobacteria bacterium]|nr:hypothetical protein [Deltaproteobacteria bacterium]